jgi:DNA polymerase III sliding clamp (beta) subunit (PCNA family)
MIFNIKRKELLEYAKKAAKAVMPSRELPELRGIHIDAADGADTIRLTATNLETSIRVTLHANVVKSGAVVINARLFLEILQKLPGEDVYIELRENNLLHISGGGANFLLSVLCERAFPVLAMPMPGETVSVSGLNSLIAATAYAADKRLPAETDNPALCCVKLDLSDDGIRATAMNRVCLAETRGDPECVGNITLLIPALSLRTLASLSHDSDVYEMGVTGEGSGKNVIFFDGTLLFSARLMDGTHFNADSVFAPFKGDARAAVDADAMRRALQNISTLAADTDNVKLSFTDGAMTLRCETELGTSETEVPATVTKVTDKAGYFSGRYLADCVRTLNASMDLAMSRTALTIRCGRTRYFQAAVLPKAKPEPAPEAVPEPKKGKKGKAA